MPTSRSPGDDAPIPLKHRVRHGAASAAAGQIGSQVVSIAALAVLLRLVGPGDYGLVGMILPIILFLRIFTTLGLQVATVQRQELSDQGLSVLFWSTLLGGLATAGIACAFAPSVSWLYARPGLHAELMRLMGALGGTLLIWAIGAQHVALLERRMQFGRLAPIRVGSQAVAAVAAIGAAFAGWGVWALVVQQYVELGLLACLAWAATGWRPSRPQWKLLRRRPSNQGVSQEPNLWGDSLRLGGYFAAASMLLFAADYVDRLLLGRYAGPDAVGLYGQAKNLMVKPVFLVTTPLSALALSGLARAAHQPRTQMEMARSFYRILAVLLMPACVGLALVGDMVMRLLGGIEWAASGALLSVLSVGLFAQATLIINGWVLTAFGKTGHFFASSVVVLVVQTLGYAIGWRIGAVYGDGVLGVAWGYAVSVLGILVVPHTLFTFRSAGLPIASLADAIGRPLMAALGMGVIVWGIGRWLETLIGMPLLAKLAIEMVAGGIAYVMLSRRETRWFRAQWSALRERRSPRSDA